MGLVFIETPEFVKKVDRLGTNEMMLLLQNELMEDPRRGKVVSGTGGARKIRVRMSGSGKSGGFRAIYYYVDLRGEVWFLDIYAKSAKADLTDSEKKNLYRFIKETIR